MTAVVANSTVDARNHPSNAEKETQKSASALSSNNKKKTGGPFSNYASESVLTKLYEFQDSVDTLYGKSISLQEQQQENSKSDEEEEDDQGNPISESSMSIGNSNSIQTVAWEHVSIENVLGEGGFSFIFRVKVRQPQSPSNFKQQEYALKCLKAKAIGSSEDLTFNAMDLYTESYLLSRLRHPNIIGIHGVINSSLSDSYLCDGYFILLDIMETTLFTELESWRSHKPRLMRTKAAIANRIQSIMMPVVNAMQYLHHHGIILRDLKPENIGFDQRGDVKLFDFGLARPEAVIEQGDVAGSICYMAPEVMLKEGTYYSSDVYSFAIILWEICTLQIPLIDFADLEEVQKRVARGNWRPTTTRIPSRTIRGLLKDCWQRDAKARPDFLSIEKILHKSCEKYDSFTIAAGSEGSEEGEGQMNPTEQAASLRRRRARERSNSGGISLLLSPTRSTSSRFSAKF